MIYTIRRFSETQKEFGWIRDKLQKTVDEENKKEKELGKILNKRDKIHNSVISRKLERDNQSIALVGKRLINTPVSSDDPPTKEEIEESKQFIAENPEPDLIDLMLFLMVCHQKNVSSIFWNNNDGLETLAHELGHVKNYRGNIFDKLIHKGAKFGKIVKEKPGVIGALFSVLGDKMINWEERNASKKAYELLKHYNLPKDDLETAKEYMNLALEKYKSESKIGWRDKILKSKISKWL